MEVLAFYLPQFHPIPENDLWWGTGFTEWTNVTRARPLFRGHHQPRLPAELGLYDLRVPDVRSAQAELAAGFGVTGFCYWHYWFAGRRLLARPLDEVVATGEPAFPFCIAWANQTWSGVWHGAPGRHLIDQTYPGDDDDAAHMASLLPALTDPRYVTVRGRPLLAVYRPGDLPEAARFVESWQGLAVAAGLPGLYLVACLGESDYCRPFEDGFDAAVHLSFPFAPDRASVWRDRLRGRGVGRGPRRVPYAEGASLPPSLPGGPVFPSVYPNWDNTPRSGRRGVVATGSTPERFEAHVRGAAAAARRLPPGEQVLVVKSWNEWAEGNYLEPDQEVGRGRLEALRRGLSG